MTPKGWRLPKQLLSLAPCLLLLPSLHFFQDPLPHLLGCLPMCWVLPPLTTGTMVLRS